MAERQRSVRIKLIGAILFSVVLTAVLCITVNVYNFSKYYHEAVGAKIGASAQSVTKSINEVLKSGELGSSGLITEWIGRECDKAKASDKDVVYVAVTDTKGMVQYHTDKELMNAAYKQRSNVIEKKYAIRADGENPGFLYIGIEKAVIDRKVRSFVLGGVLATVFIFCLVIPLAYVLVSTNVVKPLKKVTAFITDIAEGDGDLTKRVDRIESHDEFQVLAKKFNKFTDKIQEIVVKVRDNSAKVSHSASELYAKTGKMKDVISVQTNHAIEVATAVEEITESILKVAKGAGQTRDEANRSSVIAKRGEQKTTENMEIMDRLVATVESSSNAVNELGKLSDLIDQIVKAIEDIADQTNLLALNAAIEAARAGDAGRGFAVVADEVRKLAEKTGTATKDIARMVALIKDGTINAVNSMQKSKREVLESKDKIYEAKSALTEIVTVADSVMVMVGQIASASSEQSTASEEIRKNVENIKNSIMQTSSGTEYNAKLAGELQALVEELNTVIGRFRV
jgi:methyl-accepting chemotaxis protein